LSLLSAIPIIGDLIKGVTGIIDKSVADKDLKNQLESELKKIRLETENHLLEMGHDEIQGQIEINRESAKSNSLFVAGARPFILWTCGIAFAFNFIVMPLFPWILSIASIWYPEASKISQPAPLSMSEMMPVLMGLLGLGGYRTFEKTKGVANK
jgi:hypothetical protein